MSTAPWSGLARRDIFLSSIGLIRCQRVSHCFFFVFSFFNKHRAQHKGGVQFPEGAGGRGGGHLERLFRSAKKWSLFLAQARSDLAGQATPRTISVADLSLLPHLEIRPHPNPMVVCWCGWSLLLLKPSSAVQNGEESEGEMKKMLILVFLTFFTFSIHMKRNPHIQCHSKLQVNNGCNHPWRP